MEDLRLDDDFMHDEFNTQRFREYAAAYLGKTFEKRINLLLKTYDL
jgi:hypothetical protein